MLTKTKWLEHKTLERLHWKINIIKSIFKEPLKHISVSPVDVCPCQNEKMGLNYGNLKGKEQSKTRDPKDLKILKDP